MPAVETDDLEGIVTNLAAKIKAAVPALLTVEELGSNDDVLKALRRGPCCFIVFEDEGFADDSNITETIYQEGKHLWQLYIVTTSQAGPRSARLGAKGTYKISQQVKRALTGYDPVSDEEGGSYPIKWLGRRSFESEDSADYLILARISYDIENQEGL